MKSEYRDSESPSLVPVAIKPQVEDQHMFEKSHKPTSTLKQPRLIIDLYTIQLMRYHEEVLAQSARNYAYTGDKKWETRYFTIEPEAAQLLQDAAMTGVENTVFFSRMVKANEICVDLETRAIALVNQGQKYRAIALIEGNLYSEQRKVLQGGLEDYFTQKLAIHNSDKNLSSNAMSTSVNRIIELERKLAILEETTKNQKLIVIGTLAARLAHDMRNPLATIKMSILIMKARNKNWSSLELSNFERINDAISRMSHQLEHVMDFIRIKSLELEEIKLSKILESTKNAISLPSYIDLCLPENDIALICDYKQMEVVFINLIVNAIQAIENSGKISISVIENDFEIIITVSNSGKNIPAENLPYIFDPLFTTKQTGTGLGLVSVKNIIEQHGGKILIHNDPVTFTIILSKMSIPGEQK